MLLDQFRCRPGVSINHRHTSPRRIRRFNRIKIDTPTPKLFPDKPPRIPSQRHTNRRPLPQRMQHPRHIDRLPRRRPPNLHRPINLIRQNPLKNHRLLDRRCGTKAKMHRRMIVEQIRNQKPE